MHDDHGMDNAFLGEIQMEIRMVCVHLRALKRPDEHGRGMRVQLENLWSQAKDGIGSVLVTLEKVGFERTAITSTKTMQTERNAPAAQAYRDLADILRPHLPYGGEAVAERMSDEDILAIEQVVVRLRETLQGKLPEPDAPQPIMDRLKRALPSGLFASKTQPFHNH